jgi:hypothetical protein
MIGAPRLTGDFQSEKAAATHHEKIHSVTVNRSVRSSTRRSAGITPPPLLRSAERRCLVTGLFCSSGPHLAPIGRAILPHPFNATGCPMPISGELRITYAVLRRMTLSATSGRTRAARIGGAVLLVLLLMVALISGSFTGMLKPILLIALLIMFPELVSLLGWWTQRKSLDQPFRYRLTTAGVEIHSATTHLQVDWAGICRVRRGPDVWLLKRTGPQQIALPRTAFAPEDQRIIDDFLAERFPTGRARTVA